MDAKGRLGEVTKLYCEDSEETVSEVCLPSFSPRAQRLGVPGVYLADFKNCRAPPPSENKKLSYRRETARQLPTWRGG